MEENDKQVQEYMSVPSMASYIHLYNAMPTNHVFACTDLDYKRFSTTPLIVAGLQLHIYHILEAFSRTNPKRFASIWLPLIDMFEIIHPNKQNDVQQARLHLLKQQQQPDDCCVNPPNHGPKH